MTPIQTPARSSRLADHGRPQSHTCPPASRPPKSRFATDTAEAKGEPEGEAPSLQAPEAERGIVSCLLQNSKLAVPRAIEEGIHGRMFHDLRHRAIFQTLMEMHEQGVAVDLLTVVPRLREQHQFDKDTVWQVVSEIHDAAPSAANFGYYVADLKRAFHARGLDKLGRMAIVQAQVLATDSSAEGQTVLEDFRHYLQLHLGNFCKTRPQIEAVATLLADPEPRPNELVRGVLHRGSKLVLGGASKTYKTWVLLDLAVSVAAGEPWLSMKVTKGKVLIVNLEIQRPFIRDRIRDIVQDKHIRTIPEGLKICNLRGKNSVFQTLLPSLREALEGEDYSLIILDPIYKLYGNLDENKAGDVALLLNAVEELAAGTGAAIAFGAHFSKGNQAAKDSMDRISGSGVFARDPDSIMVFTRHETDFAYSVEATLRNFKPLTPFVVRWCHPLMRRDESLDPKRLRKAQNVQAKYTGEQLLTILGDRTLKCGVWRDEAMEETAISRRHFFDLLGELKKKGRVRKTDEGLWTKAPTAEASASAPTTQEHSGSGVSASIDAPPDPSAPDDPAP